MAALAARLRKSASTVRRARERAVKPRYGAHEYVDTGLQERTQRRAAALKGGLPAGVNFADGVGGRDARLVKRALADQRAKLSVPPAPGRGIGGQVRQLAQDRQRSGGIGPEVRGLAHQMRARRGKAGKPRGPRHGRNGSRRVLY